MRLPIGRAVNISAIFSKIPGFVSPRPLASTSDIYIYIYIYIYMCVCVCVCVCMCLVFCIIIGGEHKIFHDTYFPHAPGFLNAVPSDRHTGGLITKGLHCDFTRHSVYESVDHKIVFFIFRHCTAHSVQCR